MPNRIKRTIKDTISIICLGIFLYILYSIHIRIPWMFKTITHLDCPSCGVSRMCVSLSHGDIRSAFFYNQILVFLFPIIALYYAFYQIRYILTGQRKITAVENIIMIILIVILILYGIIRNMPFYPYKLPYKSRVSPTFLYFPVSEFLNKFMPHTYVERQNRYIFSFKPSCLR